MSDDYVYQLSVSIPHNGSDYAKADMVNIRGRSPEQFHAALTAFDAHMTQQVTEIAAGLRAKALVISEMGGSYVSQSQNPSQPVSAPPAQPATHQPTGYANGAQSAPVQPTDPWTGAPATAPEWVPQQQAQQAPAQGNGIPTTPPPHVGPPPSCSHGVKKFLAKPYKSGKPGYWMGWACPAQRNDPTQHELEFIRTN